MLSSWDINNSTNLYIFKSKIFIENTISFFEIY